MRWRPRPRSNALRRREYLADSDQREVIMGMLSYSRKEGLQQEQGEALLLRRLLTHRFGPLPEWAERRLTDAEPARLEAWGERVLEAQSLEAISVSYTHLDVYKRQG